MKEFSNIIEITPLEDIASIDGSTLNMVQGKAVDQLITHNDVIPNEQSSEKNGSLYYSQSLYIITDKSTSEIISKYRDIKVVVRLFTDQGDVVLFGNKDFPARCELLPNLNSDSLKITNESAEPLLS